MLIQPEEKLCLFICFSSYKGQFQTQTTFHKFGVTRLMIGTYREFQDLSRSQGDDHLTNQPKLIHYWPTTNKK
jgi:hypothetical protein